MGLQIVSDINSPRAVAAMANLKTEMKEIQKIDFKDPAGACSLKKHLIGWRRVTSQPEVLSGLRWTEPIK
jgi:hypothetical protein